eukprot:13668-Heterococcus_DN1.PRE.2
MAFYHRSVQGLGGVARTLGRVFDRVGIALEGETAVVEKCATVLDGATLEAGAVLAAGALAAPRSVIPAGQVSVSTCITAP